MRFVMRQPGSVLVIGHLKHDRISLLTFVPVALKETS